MGSNLLTMAGADFGVRHFSRGAKTFVLMVDGSDRLVCGRAECGRFSELSALENCRKVHESGDGLSLGVETRSVIPFGCEYALERDFEVCDGFARITTDLSAVNGGRLDGFALGTLTFPGWSEAELFVYGEEKMRSIRTFGGEQEFYSGREPVIALSVRFPDGVRVEYFAGSDLWRHRCGSRTTCASAEFVLAEGPDGLTLTRKLLTYETDADIEKRPWRLKELFAWRGNHGAPELPVPAGTIAADWSCLLAPVPLRNLRKAIRRSADDLAVTGAAPGYCKDPSHLDRAGKGELEHSDLDEYVSLRLWGSRQLLRRQKNFSFRVEKGPFRGTAASENLRSALRPVAVKEELE